jgi:hypothetical protein
MRAPDFSVLTNKSFEKKFKDEREPNKQGIPILDIISLMIKTAF